MESKGTINHDSTSVFLLYDLKRDYRDNLEYKLKKVESEHDPILLFTPYSQIYF